jgi:hypothetical protein
LPSTSTQRSVSLLYSGSSVKPLPFGGFSVIHSATSPSFNTQSVGLRRVSSFRSPNRLRPRNWPRMLTVLPANCAGLASTCFAKPWPSIDSRGLFDIESDSTVMDTRGRSGDCAGNGGSSGFCAS